METFRQEYSKYARLSSEIFRKENGVHARLSSEMLHIGIDDTDSRKGMCTTYIGALLLEDLSKLGEVTRQRLIRLNPNIKWKTRGNASICLTVATNKVQKVKRRVLSRVEELSELEEENTNPGVVFHIDKIPSAFSKFYHRCLHEVVKIKDAETLAENYGCEIHKFKNGRGIVGALASIGSELEHRTYEIIAYRKKENWGKTREVNTSSVVEMDRHTFPLTFNNFDYASREVLIAPSTPCPVLFGIRGENEDILKQAYEFIRVNEAVERAVIFETNQATDAHLKEVKRISEALPFSSVMLKGRISEKPRVVRGGHVIFSLSDGERSIDCAAYEPTREFRNVARELIPGDEVKVCGGVRENGNLTINLEKIEALKLAEVCEERNPICKSCGKRMESSGKGQGYRCRRCKMRANAKIKVRVERKIEEKIYQVPPRAMRHLCMPLIRGLLTIPKGSAEAIRSC